MEVKCEFILIKLTGGLSVWVFKSIFGCVLSVPKKVRVDWKSLTIFNNEIGFECGGWSGTFFHFVLDCVC